MKAKSLCMEGIALNQALALVAYTALSLALVQTVLLIVTASAESIFML